MKPAAALANLAWLASSLPAWQSYRRGVRHPEEAQQHILRRLLRENTACAYGRAHGFGDTRSYEQFCERVPVVDYEALEPFVARIMRGEPAVLTSAPVTRLVPTSGSTGGRKLIPFTAALQGEFNRAIGPWLVDLYGSQPTLALGTAYWSISPAMPVDPGERSVVPVGFDDDSAYLGGVCQRLAEATFAAPSALRLVGDMETFRYLTLLCLLRHPAWSLASVWHPSFLTLLLDALPGHWDELLADLARGGCQRAVGERPEVRRAVEASPQPARARRLQNLAPTDLHAVWPRLRLVSCWGDGQATLALANLQARLPRASIQPKGLLATEAFVSIPLQGLHPLAITSHFLEFADESGEVHPAHALRLGGRYTVIVTTGGGLWRYRLGDLVEVDGFVEGTPSLCFLGRVGGGSDLCGEKLTEPFVTRAIQSACEAAGFRPAFAMLAPERPPAYVLFVEGTPPPDFPERLEAKLRQNPHYALCRDLGQLGPLSVCQTPPGAYETFCRAQLAAGTPLGSIKPRSLSPRTDWRERFLGGSHSLPEASLRIEGGKKSNLPLTGI